MKKFIMGLIIGVAITATGSVFAEDGLQKIEAYLRPSLPITLNGQAVKLESSPVMYDGSTYLKLRDISALTGLAVNWNDATQTVELVDSKGVQPMATTVPTASTTTQEQKDQAIRSKNIEDFNARITVLMNQENEVNAIIAPYENDYIITNGVPSKKEKDTAYFEAIKKRDEIKKEMDDLNQKLAATIKEQNDYAESMRQQIIQQP
jgi:hypothetical protein